MSSLIACALKRTTCVLSELAPRTYLGAFSQPFHNQLMQYLMDSTGPPCLTYQWQEGVENLERYRPGGYHPTHIGDQYGSGRYEVVHKFGYGSYSTVWLARDPLEPRLVSLKILIAAVTQKSSECKILRQLNSGNQDHQGRIYVLSLLVEFVINGPNGRHLCIVTEAAGCSVAGEPASCYSLL